MRTTVDKKPTKHISFCLAKKEHPNETPFNRVFQNLTDIPFDEAPEDEWRIYMVPINTIFRTIQPVVEMRLKCNSNVFDDTSKVLVIEMINSETRGLDESRKRSEISLGLQGTIYCQRKKQQSRMKGEMQRSMTIVLHPMMALFAENVTRDAAELVLRSLTENTKHSVNASLLSDYAKFKRERLIHLKLQRSIDSDSHH
ncbi:hypothetical protein LIER_03660 [Lithospermum erythrorhizon]|uniref:Uncharacterized protein n=1 Tax=Lithospermum erythrorhizon TaxID=34254 RepID=A0AAV3NTZ1_LITER